MGNELYHYGVKGMKWGVRRYQNKDGRWTESGKKRRNALATKRDVDSILNSMSKDDRDKVLAGSDHYLTVDEGSTVCKRILKKYGDLPIAFFDVFNPEDGNVNVALGARSGDKYRGKGYGSEVTSKAMKWIEKNAQAIGAKNVVWGVRVDNSASIRIAEKNGFVKDESSYSDDKQWVNYVKKIKR